MHLSFLLNTVSLLQFGALTLAHGADHGGHGFPRMGVFGGRDTMRHLPQRVIEEIEGYTQADLHKRDWSVPDKDSKDSKHKRCGPGMGYCADRECCSPVGYCGTGYQHCASPNCQIDYSNGCDASIRPLGNTTLDVPRPLIGNVSYETDGIHHCQVPGTVALTFDDGPYNYTSHVLDILGTANAKATFFITGNNLGKGQIDIEENGWPEIIRRMHREGHQIAGHSWGHLNLSSLNESEVVKEVEYVEMALRNILGFFPTYFRPPYDDCTSDTCNNVLKRLGYHLTYQNIVNRDWQNDDSSRIQVSKDLFHASMNKTNPRDVNYMFLLHDTHYQSSWNLTGYMLDYFRLFNYSRLVTVAECMGDPPENWYRPAGGAAPAAQLLRKNNDGSTVQYGSLLLVFAQVLAFLFM
ncbi:hypothetical protein NX059_003549 [Plenodomus lindquistii]|nr:hypothetical protein NX059_003549 [Plenodomus lindquistii]